MKCEKCNNAMELKKKEIPTEKQLKQKYWFKRYYFCKNCNFIKNIEKYKVTNI